MTNPRYPLTVAQPPVAPGRRAAVGTPKALVDQTSSSVSAFAKPLKHEVTFVVEGTTVERVYTVETSSVESAVSALNDATDALALKVKVKKVTVHF